MIQQLSAVLIFQLLLLLPFAQMEIIEECNDLDSEYIPSSKGCKYYIFCHGQDSFEDECPSETPYFSAAAQVCDTDPLVCNNSEIDTVEGTVETVQGDDGNSTIVAATNETVDSTSATPATPVVALSTASIATSRPAPPTAVVSSTVSASSAPEIPETSPGISSASSETTSAVTETTTAVSATTSASSATTSVTSETNTAISITSEATFLFSTIPTTSETSPLPTTTVVEEATTTKSDNYIPNVEISQQCPKTDHVNKIVFLASKTSCSQYYICYNGEAIEMHCSTMLHFDLSQKKCDFPAKAQCVLQNVSPRDQCLPKTFDVYPHPTNCKYYYVCNFGYLMVMECPINTFWDHERRACTRQPGVKCYAA